MHILVLTILLTCWLAAPVLAGKDGVPGRRVGGGSRVKSSQPVAQDLLSTGQVSQNLEQRHYSEALD